MINFTKSQPEPSDLAIERAKTSGTYVTTETLEKLKKDFFDKCYICEYKNPTTLNVEHLISHKGNRELKFDWENLFLACSHCNNIKGNQYDNILNCTEINDDIENAIKVSLDPPFITKKVVVTPLNSEVRTMRTTELLNKVYNGTTTMKSIEAHYIRESLSKEILKFISLLSEYFTVYEQEYKNLLKLQIKNELHRSSSFAGFKRWLVREDEILSEHFNSYIN